MTDRELLELAAKAAGFTLELSDYWNPLEDDGDAFDLACALEMTVIFNNGGRFSWARAEMIELKQANDDDRKAAARRVIVRVAAEIGRSMK